MWNIVQENCEKYLDSSNYVSVEYVIDEWCKSDPACREVKKLAILSACENKLIKYIRDDYKNYDDPVTELYGRGILQLDKQSFYAWKDEIEKTHSQPSSKPKVAQAQPANSQQYQQQLKEKDEEIRRLKQRIEQLEADQLQPVNCEQEKELHPRAANNGANIIKALMAMAKLDITKPYAAYASVEAQGQALGLDMPSAETFKKWVK